MARAEKMSEAIKKEISMIIHDELKDPRLGFVTITAVKLTPDMRYAKIHYSVLGRDADYARTKAALDSGSGFIRHLLAERIRMRFVPEIIFKEDRSSEYSIRIQEVLEEIKQLQPAEPAAEPKQKGPKRKGGRRESKKSCRVLKKKK